MAIKDLTEFLGDTVLSVKVSGKANPDGKTYRIAEPDADTGLYLMALAQTAKKTAAGAEVTSEEVASLQFEGGREVDLTRMVLGDVYDELRADRVPLRKIAGVTQYAFIYFTMGEGAADQMVSSSGEAPAPNRKARRKASRAGATTTTQPASTAGTTSPRKRKPKPKAT